MTLLELERILVNLKDKSVQNNLPRFVQENIEQLLYNLKGAQSNYLLEQKLLKAIQDFYRPLIRSTPENVVLSVGIKRVFGGQGKPQTYRIGIRVGRDQTGRSLTGILVGAGGKLVNALKDALKPYGVDGIDFEE